MRCVDDNELVDGPFASRGKAEQRAQTMNTNVDGREFLHPVGGMDELCVYGVMPDDDGRWWVAIIPVADAV